MPRPQKPLRLRLRKDNRKYEIVGPHPLTGKGDMTKEEMVAMARSIFEEPHPLELKYAEEEAKSDSA